MRHGEEARAHPGAGGRVSRRPRFAARAARFHDAEDTAGVRGRAARQRALAGGRVAARSRVPVRAPGRALGHRGRRADHASEGAAGALPLRVGGRAPVDPRRAARARGRAFPRPGGAVNASKFARLLVDYCLEAQAGQQVQVSSTTLAEPLLLELQRELLEREAWPLLDVSLPGQAEGFWAAARDVHLDGFPSADLAVAERVDATLRIQASSNANELAGVDPSRLTRAARARDPLREARLARRWAITLWPTAAAAQQAGMGTREFEDFVSRALFLDRDDPAAAWGELRSFQAGLIERLAPKREIRIEADGTDLTLDVGGRTWINSDGRRNMPSGEVFTGPVESSAEGVVRFTIPTSPRGVVVEDVTLEFREGRVVSARAERGDGYLQAA